MRGSIIWHTGTLRLHSDDSPVPGPYEWACTVTSEGPDGQIAHLHAVDKPVPSRHALRKLLKELGYTRVRWWRWVDEESEWRPVERPL